MWLNIFVLSILASLIFAIDLNLLQDDAINPLAGRVCAYGDMNKDQYTDIIVHDDQYLIIYFQSESSLNFSEYKHFSRIQLKSIHLVVHCTVADFNGDSWPDILVAWKNPISDGYYQLAIYIHTITISGAGTENHAFNFIPIQYKFIEQPSVVEINGDGIGDVIGFDTNEHFVCLLGSSNLTFEDCTKKFDAYRYGNVTRRPYDNLAPIFTDLTDDLSAEIIFCVKIDEKLTFDVFQLSNIDENEWQYNKSLSDLLQLPTNTPFEMKYFGNPVVADFDSNGTIDILLPVCYDNMCKKVDNLFIWTSTYGWTHLRLDLQDHEIYFNEPNKDFLFRVGDFSLDGFPDLIFTANFNNQVVPVILENNEYNDNANFSRKFELQSSTQYEVMPVEMSKGKIVLAAFFDLKEDGNLDILVEYNYKNNTYIDFIKCDDKGDTTFLKVQIFTNRNENGTGVSWHGACSSYSTTDFKGQMRNSTQCQMPQTSNRALYSPYALFGLGRASNFVEQLKFGTPRQLDHSGVQAHKIQQIVPNSRIIAIPPKNLDSNWKIRLYVTPNSLIFKSLFVLLTLCGILVLVIIGLHIQEKHADKKERQSQALRFHFDAM